MIDYSLFDEVFADSWVWAVSNLQIVDHGYFLDESQAKHPIVHVRWRFDIGICMSEWLQLKIHHNYQDKELHQMGAVFLGNQDTVNFSH